MNKSLVVFYHNICQRHRTCNQNTNYHLNLTNKSVPRGYFTQPQTWTFACPQAKRNLKTYREQIQAQHKDTIYSKQTKVARRNTWTEFDNRGRIKITELACFTKFSHKYWQSQVYVLTGSVSMCMHSTSMWGGHFHSKIMFHTQSIIGLPSF